MDDICNTIPLTMGKKNKKKNSDKNKTKQKLEQLKKKLENQRLILEKVLKIINH